MRQIARLSRKYKFVITHGNGPQVGNLLLQQESYDKVPKMPLEIIGAMTQGQIGYMLESSLDDALMEIGVNGEQQFVTLITYVVVDQNDPGFKNPTKPIGPSYSEAEASRLSYTMAKTDKGYRRVVASPRPLNIVEHREIKKLIDLDFIVICCGGGGIPVIRKERKFRGVEAVIDKDLAIEAVTHTPIERIEILNAKEVVQTLRGYSDSTTETQRRQPALGTGHYRRWL